MIPCQRPVPMSENEPRVPLNVPKLRRIGRVVGRVGRIEVVVLVHVVHVEAQVEPQPLVDRPFLRKDAWPQTMSRRLQRVAAECSNRETMPGSGNR